MRKLLLLLFLVYCGLNTAVLPPVFPHSKDPHHAFLFKQETSHFTVSLFEDALNDQSEEDDHDFFALIWPETVPRFAYRYIPPVRAPGSLAWHCSHALNRAPLYILHRQIRI